MNHSEEFADQIHELKFYVQRCIRYHMHRAAFFSRCSRITSFTGVLFGSAALTSIIGEAPKEIALYSALLVTAVSALDLVVGTSQRAWQHNDLRKRFIGVELKLLGSNLSDASVLEVQSSIRQIEADEPPGLALLNEIAHNEVIRSTYPASEAEQHVSRMPWLKRATANLIDWDVSKYLSPAANPEKA